MRHIAGRRIIWSAGFPCYHNAFDIQSIEKQFHGLGNALAHGRLIEKNAENGIAAICISVKVICRHMVIKDIANQDVVQR